MTTKKIQKSKVLRGKQKYRFELAPSRYPLAHKRLWNLEDSLQEVFTNADITRDKSTLDSYCSIFTDLYSSDYLWLDYSSYLYSVYELRSVSCYSCVRNISFVGRVYSKQIKVLVEDLVSYYRDTLNIHPRNIKPKKIESTCTWFVYHLNRAKRNKSLGMKLSYDRGHYTKYNDNVSGNVVQKLVDMLESQGVLYIFKGYHLKELSNKNFTITTKAAMTLLVFRGDELDKYCHHTPLSNPQLESHKPKVFVEDLIEVRVKSKCKDKISKEDYPVEWNDKLRESEAIMKNLHSKLQDSLITVGGYEIPELTFRRIWIGDIYSHGRVYDNGGFQGKSKFMRKGILIDGSPTVTIDLSALHPRILYSMENIKLPWDFDPYPNLSLSVDTKRVEKFKRFYNIKKYNPKRSLAKVTLLILLNAKSIPEAKGAILSKIRRDSRKGMTCQENYMDFIGIPENVDIDKVIKEVMGHNKEICKYFATGASTMLMNKDSEIIVNAIDKLSQIDCACLPLHDSITVREDYKEDAINALKFGYKEVIGNTFNFKYEIE